VKPLRTGCRYSRVADCSLVLSCWHRFRFHGMASLRRASHRWVLDFSLASGRGGKCGQYLRAATHCQDAECCDMLWPTPKTDKFCRGAPF
jgi:hypothetical protein